MWYKGYNTRELRKVLNIAFTWICNNDALPVNKTKHAES